MDGWKDGLNVLYSVNITALKTEHFKLQVFF